MDLEVAEQLAGLQEALTTLGQRVILLNIAVKSMLEILRRDPEFREEYQTAFDIHKTASQTEADAAALEQKLAAIRSTLPKTGQA